MKDVFEVLEPPPHGLTRLRAAMEERKRRPVVWPVLVAAAAVLIIVKVEPPNTFTTELERRGQPQSEAVVARGETAVEAVPSSSSDVVIYRVAIP